MIRLNCNRREQNYIARRTIMSSKKLTEKKSNNEIALEAR